MIRNHAAPSIATARGCTLVEVLVATTCLVVALAWVAQAFNAAARTARRASQIGRAAILAQDKMEELVFRVASDAALAESPSDALTTDVDGCFDIVGGFVRRWSIVSLREAPAEAMVIEVLVMDAETRASARAVPASDGVRLATIRRRAT